MTVQELKQNIINKTLTDKFLIFQSDDDNFLVNQYIDAICALHYRDKNYITSIYEPFESALSLVVNYNENINILKVDDFSEFSDNYDQFINVIVICKTINKKISSLVEDYVVKFTKPLVWQVKEYMKAICPNMDAHSYDLLYNSLSQTAKINDNDKTDINIYRLTNILDKINTYEDNKTTILNSLLYDKYSDIYTCSMFNLSNAIESLDLPVLYDYFMKQENTNLDSIALTNMLLKKFKLILAVKHYQSYNQLPSILKQTISDKQFPYLIRSKYSINSLEKIVKFLANIDLRLKDYEFDGINSNTQISYIISQIICMANKYR